MGGDYATDVGGLEGTMDTGSNRRSNRFVALGFRCARAPQ
jgi:hypothetical protein